MMTQSWPVSENIAAAASLASRRPTASAKATKRAAKRLATVTAAADSVMIRIGGTRRSTRRVARSRTVAARTEAMPASAHQLNVLEPGE